MSGEYEQMELDFRLESEKDLKDNVSRVIQFAYAKRKMEAETYGRDIPAVRNKHEGYGIAAEAWSKIQVKEKDIKNGMGDYLALLQVQGEEAIQSVARLYDAALNLAVEAINMAADMNRVLNDLYYGIPNKTPIEEYAEAIEGEEEFEEAELNEAEPDEDVPEVDSKEAEEA